LKELRKVKLIDRINLLKTDSLEPLEFNEDALIYHRVDKTAHIFSSSEIDIKQFFRIHTPEQSVTRSDIENVEIVTL